jgi:hypothetical protein
MFSCVAKHAKPLHLPEAFRFRIPQLSPLRRLTAQVDLIIHPAGLRSWESLGNRNNILMDSEAAVGIEKESPTGLMIL